MKTIKLNDWSTMPPSTADKETLKKESKKLVVDLALLQEKLFAQHKYSVLIVIQGMDTSGKDSAVKHVFSGVNPAGCAVKSFKKPTELELNQHFLWRISNSCPSTGMMQIFNRSHYEDILIPLSRDTISTKALQARMKEIESFEKGLVENNTLLFKFYLHISYKEQLIRLESRKSNPNKQWKLNKEDSKDISKHKTYRKIYEYILSQSNKVQPWEIIPSDCKWYKNHTILNSLVNRLGKMDIEFPTLSNEA